MDLSVGLVVVVVLALAFDLTNGFHDSSNSLAAPVATRAMTPRQALVGHHGASPCSGRSSPALPWPTPWAG